MPFREQSPELLGPDGPFADLVPGFQSRNSQIVMACAVERCLHDNSVVVVESGTGTGKTFAYLVPALLSGGKVMISTGTKPLQDQLYHRDIPSVLRALGTTARVALLKGRANYLCLYRLPLAMQQLDLLPDDRMADLLAVEQWSRTTRSGDLNELTSVAEDSPVRPLVSSTADNCLGAKCRHYDECHVNRARRAALAADVLVINHHLFCADLVLREDGFGQLLPGADALIFDEAHQLAEVASNFLGVTLTSNQIRELCRDADVEERKEQSQIRGLKQALAVVEQQRDALSRALPVSGDRLAWSGIDEQPEFIERLNGLVFSVSELSDCLELAAPAGEGLQRCWQRALSCADRLSRFAEPANDRFVRWAETGQHWFRFHETPLNPGDTLKAFLDDPSKAWLYTSATLSVRGDFTYFLNQLGIEAAATHCLDSPFDYTRQARLYLPPDLPDPRQASYTSEVIARVLPVIDIVDGRTFCLFTSHSALREAYSILSDRSDYHLLMQGQMPRTELLQRFRSTPRSVLLGTSSFWEGVDVRGQALSCVIIDKLPFESPSDPVLRARLEAIEAGGGRAFIDRQLPHAVIALKQGVGRLIRDSEDFGVLVLCDPRLLSKSYGKVFLDSLPRIPRTRKIEDIEQFFKDAAERYA